MKRVLMCCGVVFAFCLLALSGANAEDTTSAGSTDEQSQGTSSGSGYKEEIAGDKAAIKAEAGVIEEHASTAKQEEKQLKGQIRAAEQSGDIAIAKHLREQLKGTHQANAQERQQDKQTMKSARQELRQDKKEARQAGILPPRRDNDNNPPGPVGGSGTNWENIPGPQGGPGASPDQRPAAVRSNPPGPRGGPGVGGHGGGHGGDRR